MGNQMIEYKSNVYVEPSVSYFDGVKDSEKAVTTAFPIAVGLALVAAVATSTRGSQNTLDR